MIPTMLILSMRGISDPKNYCYNLMKAMESVSAKLSIVNKK